MVLEKSAIGRHGETEVSPSGESELERRYQALLALTLRTGAWLTSNENRLDRPAWEGAFAEYRENLQALQALGEQRRPSTLRDGDEPLAGGELAAEVAELFAA